MMVNLNSRGVWDMANDNFKWLTYDIDSSIVLKVIYKNNEKIEDYAVFNIIDVLDVSGDSLNIMTANIEDLTNLLTIGIVRFANMGDLSDVIDIPFRNLYKLYENSNKLGENTSLMLSFSDIDAFSVIDGSVRSDCKIYSTIINDFSSDLSRVMEIASEFGSYRMMKKFEALSEITLINHRRLVNDKINRMYNNNNITRLNNI